MSTHHQVLIIGGGTAGITVASTLLKKRKNLDVGIIEPSEIHYYQPAWTLVAGGVFDVKKTARPMKDYIPKRATWIKELTVKLLPDENKVQLKSGAEVTYDYLVVCPGIQIDWHKIKGLEAGLNKGGVCSNYDYGHCQYTWDVLQNFKGGTALFTNPNTPIKCGGAPQKIMYLASDYFRKHGLLEKTNVRFTTAGGRVFGVDVFEETLKKVIARYGIKTDFHHNLKEIKGETNEAVFDILENGKPIKEVTMKYDMIHVTPPMSAPDFIKQSPLANENGWVDLDKHSLQSTKYSNVFGLGDAGGTPNAKTGAAVRKQAPVVVDNLIRSIEHNGLSDLRYNGYGSCPLITGYGKLVLAEFDYDNQPTPSFPIDQTKERYSMYLMKKYFLPWMYWNKMLKGNPL